MTFLQNPRHNIFHYISRLLLIWFLGGFSVNGEWWIMYTTYYKCERVQKHKYFMNFCSFDMPWIWIQFCETFLFLSNGIFRQFLNNIPFGLCLFHYMTMRRLPKVLHFSSISVPFSHTYTHKPTHLCHPLPLSTPIPN